MRLRVREVRQYERPVVLRLPFRFGVVTLREAPQLFVRARIELEDGSGGWGCAAELLAPKWFDKNPDLSNQENFQQLRDSAASAARLYQSDDDFHSPFGLFAANYQPQIDACRDQGLNPLIASFGPALLDRAVLDALCRLQGMSFFDAMRTNLPGLQPVPLVPDLKDFAFDRFLSSLIPRRRLHARHTVGLIDPLSESDLKPEDRIGDGLPESLEAAIAAYGHIYFKIKVSGELDQDIRRLKAITGVLDRLPAPYFVTLDGNEQFASVAEFNQLLEAVNGESDLKRFRETIIFVEQPLNRRNALGANLTTLKSTLPVIIDESDDTLDAFPAAVGCGYRGVSSKACKGFYKSIINAARCTRWNRDARPPQYFMSAEDLTVQPGISLQQDLAIVALLGLEHVERNGHHYVNGMAGASPEEERAFLEAHPDLYEESAGAVRLKIRNGQIQVESLNTPGFASAAEPKWDMMSGSDS